MLILKVPAAVLNFPVAVLKLPVAIRSFTEVVLNIPLAIGEFPILDGKLPIAIIKNYLASVILSFASCLYCGLEIVYNDFA